MSFIGGSTVVDYYRLGFTFGLRSRLSLRFTGFGIQLRSIKVPVPFALHTDKHSVPVHGTNTHHNRIQTTHVFHSTLCISVLHKKFHICNCVYGKTSTFECFEIGSVERWTKIKRAETADFHVISTSL